MSKRRIVGVISVGHVGAHVAYSLAVQGIVDELVLVDINQAKLECECQDIADGVSWMSHRVRLRVGDYSDLGDCDVIVNCAGKSILMAEHNSRLDELGFTLKAVDGFIAKIMASGFHGVILNVANPCDVVTNRIAQLSGLPKGHVFGTGTGLDTARLRSALAKQTGIDHKSISAYVMGEHGASQMIPWSLVSFGGRPLNDWAKTDERFKFDHRTFQKEAANAGWVVYSVKHCTEYGICSTAARLVEVVLLDEKQIMPVSAPLSGEYGESDIYIGVPAVVGANGAEEVVELPMSPEELAEFKNCCAALRETMALAAEIK